MKFRYIRWAFFFHSRSLEIANLHNRVIIFFFANFRVFQEMLYGIQAGFGSPQVPVAELLARPVPSLLSPQAARPKTSNFLQVPDIESAR